MELIQILANALLEVDRVEQSAADNDTAYRKQMRIILNSPTLRNAIARARDAPAPPKARKPKVKPDTTD